MSWRPPPLRERIMSRLDTKRSRHNDPGQSPIIQRQRIRSSHFPCALDDDASGTCDTYESERYFADTQLPLTSDVCGLGMWFATESASRRW